MEEYIEECLDSLKKVTLPKEIIVVNDGSKDHTKEKILELMQGDDSIILIDQANQGQSAARNNALAQARGKYFYFTDADDYIYPEAFTAFLNYANSNDLDACAVLFDNQKSPTNTKTYYTGMKDVFSGGKILRGSDFMLSSLKNLSYGAEVCLYLFKREMCTDLSFPKDMKKHEDDYFIAEAISSASTIGFFDQSVYFRRYRENSISRGKNNIPSRSIPDIVKNIEHFSSRANNSVNDANKKVFAILACRSLMSLIDYRKYTQDLTKNFLWQKYKNISPLRIPLKWRFKIIKSLLKL